jgi:hypothetical protein
MTIIEKLHEVDDRFQPLIKELYSDNENFAKSYLLVLEASLRMTRSIEILD